MTEWLLDERLANDCEIVGDLPLCRALLMRDARFPWLILAPRRIGVSDLHQLSASDRAVLIEECAAVSDALQHLTGAEKMNVAALGNVVAQLHVHIIARFTTDAAWPRPVWNSGAPTPYAAGEAESLMEKLRGAVGGLSA